MAPESGERSATEGSLSEVITREPLPLSLAALEWLQEAGHLCVGPASPLRSVLRPECRTSAEERSSAREALVQRGIVSSKRKQKNGFSSSPRALAFSNSMRILERPECRVRLSILAPGERSTVIPLFLAGENAVFGFFSPLLFHVCKPVSISELRASIVRHLERDRAQGGSQRLAIHPNQIRLSSLIWPAAKQRSTDAVRREVAVGALQRAGLSTQAALKAISGLVQNHFAEESDSAIKLRRPYRAAMDLIWSGHLFCIEREPLQEAGAGGASKPKDSGTRLLFVGPPGRRVLCRPFNPVSAGGGNPENKEATPSDLGQRREQLLNLEYLAKDLLHDLIKRFFRA